MGLWSRGGRTHGSKHATYPPSVSAALIRERAGERTCESETEAPYGLAVGAVRRDGWMDDEVK